MSIQNKILKLLKWSQPALATVLLFVSTSAKSQDHRASDQPLAECRQVISNDENAIEAISDVHLILSRRYDPDSTEYFEFSGGVTSTPNQTTLFAISGYTTTKGHYERGEARETGTHLKITQTLRSATAGGTYKTRNLMDFDKKQGILKLKVETKNPGWFTHWRTDWLVLMQCSPVSH